MRLIQAEGGMIKKLEAWIYFLYIDFTLLPGYLIQVYIFSMIL
jgi:hypothetical protein